MSVKQRGIGTTTQSEKAELTCPDGTAYHKSAEVNDKIMEITHIDKNQFRMIEMIAQGDFSSVLNADTKDRQGILEKIFSTQNYNILQRRLKDDLSKSESELELKKSSLREKVHSIELSPELAETVQEDESEGADWQSDSETQLSEGEHRTLADIYYDLRDSDAAILSGKAAEFALRLADMDEDRAENARDEVKKIESSLEAVNSQISLMNEISGLKKEIDADKITLSINNQAASDADTKLKDANDRKPEREGWVSKAGALQASMDDYRKLDSSISELNKAASDIKDADSSLASCLENIDRADRRKAGLDKRIGELDGVDDKILANSKNLTEAKAKRDSLDSLLSLLSERESIRRKLISAKAAFDKAEHEKDEAVSLYSVKRSAFLSEQAGILACELEQGEPCPVCGSTEHPDPAEKSEGAPTEAELNKLEKAKNDKEKAFSKADKDLSNLINDLNKKHEDIKKAALADPIKEITGQIELNVDGDYSALAGIIKPVSADLDVEIRGLNDRALELGEDKKELEESRRQLPDVDALLRKLREEESVKRQEIASLQSKQESLAANIDEIRRGLEFESSAAAQAEIKRLDGLVKAFDKDIDKLTEEKNLADREVSRLEGVIKAKQKTLDEKTAQAGENTPSLSELADKQCELNSTRTKLSGEADEAAIRAASNRKTGQGIRNGQEELAEDSERWQMIKVLSDTANARTAADESGKIILETYVLSYYFDQIIESANTHMVGITGGRYQLERSRRAKNRSSQTGLDLDVIDINDPDDRRSVSTLSGGETFTASLSLALGVSDYIQAEAGGVRLDTMFVDEGFGTLDDKELDDAINMLASLSDNNRLIGIISHVDKLRDRIDNKIVVEKQGDGTSHVRLELNS